MRNFRQLIDVYRSLEDVMDRIFAPIGWRGCFGVPFRGCGHEGEVEDWSSLSWRDLRVERGLIDWARVVLLGGRRLQKEIRLEWKVTIRGALLLRWAGMTFMSREELPL